MKFLCQGSILFSGLICLRPTRAWVDTVTVPSATCPRPRIQQPTKVSCLYSSWSDLEDEFRSYLDAPRPVSIDSARDSSKPTFSTDAPTFFRERHGWCPYSERVWLTLEHLNIPYDTIRIDNTGGPRPSYFAGQTPQIRWPDGRTQGESMDLVRDLDNRYNNGHLQAENPEVCAAIDKFRLIFPRARPSSRAAFLFQNNGEPLWKSTFQETLRATDELISNSPGPFFCGYTFTAADIAWAPFLERYRYQLPCLHEGLEPFDLATYPHLAAWYTNMEAHVPAYISRVKGDASSWRKVLSMAGFGNAGIPPNVASNMNKLLEKELAESRMILKHGDLFQEYASQRPYTATSAAGQAALTVIQNRNAILEDLHKQQSRQKMDGIPDTVPEMEDALYGLVQLLLGNDDASTGKSSQTLALFLDERMCVPRDMGSMSAACIKSVAHGESIIAK